MSCTQLITSRGLLNETAPTWPSGRSHILSTGSLEKEQTLYVSIRINMFAFI